MLTDKNFALFQKGTFAPINQKFLTEGVCCLQSLSKLQDKYKKPDIDTVLNELHDSMVGRYLGFALVNTEKHGKNTASQATREY